MALPDPISRRLTYEDLLQLPDDGLRHELIGDAPASSTSGTPVVPRIW